MEALSRAAYFLLSSKTQRTSDQANRSQMQVQDALTCPLKGEAILSHNLKHHLQITRTPVADMAYRPELPHVRCLNRNAFLCFLLWGCGCPAEERDLESRADAGWAPAGDAAGLCDSWFCDSVFQLDSMFCCDSQQLLWEVCLEEAEVHPLSAGWRMCLFRLWFPPWCHHSCCLLGFMSSWADSEQEE